MPIRRSPFLTPRSIAARRANAQKSTGPRTPAGKARVSLNALKHGRSMGPAGRAPRFRERLLRAGYPYQEALYGDLRSCLAEAFGARSPYWRRQVDQFAASAWCVVMGRHFIRTKLECAFESEAKASRVLSKDHREACSQLLRSRVGWARSLRYRAEDPWRRIGVAFWVQRRRYLTRARARRMFRGQEPVSLGPANEGLENRVRCLVFRLRRPGYFERLRYSLDRNGDPDWSRLPWRSLPRYREQWEAARRTPPLRESDCRSHFATPPASSPPGEPVFGAGSHLGSADSTGATPVSSPENGLTGRIRCAASQAVARVLTLVSWCLR
jgi:hypothetical protein